MRRIVVPFIVAVLMASWAVSSTGAQNTASAYIVQIREGACDAPGDGLAQLGELTYAGADAVGAAGAAEATSLYAVAPVSLENLTTSTTAIFVLDAETNGLVACGEIGGVLRNDGALSIGLRPVNDSGFSGIAYLAPDGANPSQTGISTFLAVTGTGGDGEAAPADPPLDAAAYSSMINSQLVVLVGSLQRIDTLFDQANAGDSGWVSQVGAELFLWKLLYGVAQDIEPPAEFAGFDEQYRGALALLDSAATDITQALQTSDEALLADASTKIQDAVTALRGLQSSQPSATPAGTPTP